MNAASFWKHLRCCEKHLMLIVVLKRIGEQPEWFNDHRKATISDDYVKDPTLLLKIRGIEVEKVRERRRSLVGLITG